MSKTTPKNDKNKEFSWDVVNNHALPNTPKATPTKADTDKKEGLVNVPKKLKNAGM